MISTMDFEVKGSALTPLITENGPSPLSFMKNRLWFFTVNSILEVLSGGTGADHDEGGNWEQQQSAYRHLLDNTEVVGLLDKTIDGLLSSGSNQKMASKSVEFRTLGNRFYQSSQFHEALAYYTFAIINAPNVDETRPSSKVQVPEELSLAFGNRSAVFFQLDEYVACLSDLEHALATGYPRNGCKYNKIAIRKIECLIYLDRMYEAKEALGQLLRSPGFSLKDIDTEKLAFIREAISNVKEIFEKKASPKCPNKPYNLTVIENLKRNGRFTPSKDIAPFSTKVKIVEDIVKGRSAVARKEIEPGELISVEAPYCQVIDAKWDFYLCHHCNRRLEDRIVDESNGKVKYEYFLSQYYFL